MVFPLGFDFFFARARAGPKPIIAARKTRRTRSCNSTVPPGRPCTKEKSVGFILFLFSRQCVVSTVKKWATWPIYIHTYVYMHIEKELRCFPRALGLVCGMIAGQPVKAKTTRLRIRAKTHRLHAIIGTIESFIFVGTVFHVYLGRTCFSRKRCCIIETRAYTCTRNPRIPWAPCTLRSTCRL